MQLYQNRDFNSFFQDTFTFLKEHGKHFFTHFFTISGALIIVLAVVSYYITKTYTESLMYNFSTRGTASDAFDQFANENFGAFILTIIGVVILTIVFWVIVYAFTPIYFKLFEKHNGTNFGMKEITDSYKANIGKLLGFVVFGFILAIPLAIVFGIVGFILAITIVGILALPFLVGIFSSLYHMTLLEQLDNKRNFWDSFGYAWQLISSKFWHAVGCIGIFYLMAYVIQMGIGFIQGVVQGVQSITVIQEPVGMEDMSIGSLILAIVISVISFIISTTLQTIIQVNQSIVYYGLKETSENVNTKSVIDQIGSGE
ncbi:hypothetical protein [Mesoflavibacter sp. CH_XMU1404-2]|uniref:hypothetical protein n=1 Tax=Mesoflavibacter sp. CH_XMU1404-2 TaxID=3107766 RepID=UPI00300A538E